MTHWVEFPDGFHFLTEELDAIWAFIDKGEDIYDTTTYGELTRLIDIIYFLKVHLKKLLVHPLHVIGLISAHCDGMI